MYFELTIALRKIFFQRKNRYADREMIKES